jgi:hypothetical protein
MASTALGPLLPLIRPPRPVVALFRSLSHSVATIPHIAQLAVASIRRIDGAELWDASMRIAARLLLSLAVSVPDGRSDHEGARHSW